MGTGLPPHVMSVMMTSPEPPPRKRTEKMFNQTTLQPRLSNYACFLSFPVLSLLYII
jgi:hypothetical protein